MLNIDFALRCCSDFRINRVDKGKNDPEEKLESPVRPGVTLKANGCADLSGESWHMAGLSSLEALPRFTGHAARIP
jgi:hypothetical protein